MDEGKVEGVGDKTIIIGKAVFDSLGEWGKMCTWSFVLDQNFAGHQQYTKTSFLAFCLAF